MIIQSDWHIHSECSYDASLTLEEIKNETGNLGFKKFGITDHANFNDKSFIADIRNSAKSVKEFQKIHPEAILGVELTPIEKPEFDYIAKTGTRDGYIAPITGTPYDMELAQTKEHLIELGVRYAIGAAHWRVDIPNGRNHETDLDVVIKEWYRQQMWLICDERVTVLGHPWYSGRSLWYKDFSVIPRSMNMDIAAALKEKKKYVECNSGMLCSKNTSEKFRNQYAEFIRELFEMGIPVTHGSDSHRIYTVDRILETEKLLASVGFKEGEISDITDEDLW